MFQKVLEHRKLTITLILTHPHNELISYDNTISIITDLHFINDTKQISVTNDKLHAKQKKIAKPNNTLMALKIKSETDCSVRTSYLYTILKKHIPTVFDPAYIRQKNILHNLREDYDVIYNSACAILGEHEVREFELKKALNINDKESLEMSYELISSFDSYPSG